MMQIRALPVCTALILLPVLVPGIQASDTYGFVAKWGSAGSGDGQFQMPVGIATDAGGNVYITDTFNNRVQKFALQAAVKALPRVTSLPTDPDHDGLYEDLNGNGEAGFSDVVQLTFPNDVVPTPTTTIEPTPTTTQNPGPIAGFTAEPTTSVAPLSVQFTDESTGQIADYAWDFNNDGNIDSTEKDPTYTYPDAGTFTVKLTVTGASGSDDETKTNYITATPGPTPTPIPAPVAQFSGVPTSGYAPLTVQFTDESTGSYNAIYLDFNDDLSPDSMVKNPSYTYNAPGIYNVSMLVSGPGGVDYEQKFGYIVVTAESVPAPVAQFSAQPTTGDAPLTVKFSDASTGSITGYSWDFENDGIPDSTEQSPEHIYTLPGTYAVNLTVTGPGGADDETKPAYISVNQPLAKPVANFTADPLQGTAPMIVTFTDTSSGSAITAWAWDFESDGSIDSTDKNPVHIYATADNYTVNLTVANAGGSNESVKTDYISVMNVPAPVVEFSANLIAGMAPLSVQFTDESKGIGLISWSWNFNNDKVVDSIEQNPVYNFATPGNYTVSLAVKGNGGTTTTTKVDYIIVSAVPPAAPKAEFVGKPTSGKAPFVVKFANKSVGKNITAWARDFNGDGVTDSVEQNPSYTYTSRGNYNVSLTVTNAGGSNSKFKKNYIKVSQLEKPQADFKADKQSGNAPLTLKFTDSSKGDSITKWSWDFNNDGLIDSTQKNPTYTYASAGKYAVKLVVTNAAGSDMEVKSDFITGKGDSQPAGKKPVAVIFADKTWGTPPMTVKFADQSLNNPTSRTWYFGDGSSSQEANLTHLYADPGIYFARLYVENKAGTDQDYRFIFVLPKWLAMWNGR